MHSVWPCSCWCVPAAHRLHAAWPLALKLPAEHCTGAIAPATQL